ncbi:hypothetical protein F5I97DRAFT_1923079 [Phlebopus sp. FC_14]|nr:hypothetical protein F5I97DRAFT_1923079 [Phlebopus sp. FC_14]
MGTLQIENRNEEDDLERDKVHLKYPLNTWFARQSLLDRKAGAVLHPDTKEWGLIIASHFVELGKRIVRVGHLEEREEDLKVRDWLMEVGGVKESDMQWISLVDDYDITSDGIEPKELKWIVKRVHPSNFTIDTEVLKAMIRNVTRSVG